MCVSIVHVLCYLVSFVSSVVCMLFAALHAAHKGRA